MKVLVIGSGGREHVLAWKIAQSPLLTKLYAAPGNAGIEQLAECHPYSADDIQGLCEFAKNEKIDLTIVGPESPLVAGIVDLFQKEGLKIFGPTQAAARLEGSKAFAKDQMVRFGVPTAHYESFSNVNEAKQYAIEAEMPVVIKADGLASGKGVVICESSHEAVKTITQMMSEGVFGDSGRKIIIEKMLEGEEISILALTDGEKILPLASSQDHKRVYDYDRGPNTGGMGAYSPCPQIPDEKIAEAVDLTIRPIVKGMAKEGSRYRGILYAGLMMTKEGPFVLEYNCRFGDPETQAVLPRLKSDLLAVMAEIANGNLKTERLEWDDRACLAVVMASGGYPGFYHKGFVIDGIEVLEKKSDFFVFHAGTARNAEGKFVTAGGRVLAVAALGDNLRAAHDRVYRDLSRIRFEGGFFRRDIGRRALEVYR
ncbi:MAG: phosphoribosylamine--glycine ligase [Candidatus Omnitrophica bacterium]|nr:phosphoribosylamine--glycine ligase [Candidatus Omnitrophota bacterium]MDD5671216.1 phosphoribosylamine--glycine ligase [Candidatus Omnitrophota bacterium]